MKKFCHSFLILPFLLPLTVCGTDAAPNTPQWQRERDERAQELQDLQRENAAGYVNIDTSQPTTFPSTVDDLSFSARTQLEQEGLEPYKDLKAYRELELQTKSDYCNNGHLDEPMCAEYKAKAEAKKKKNDSDANSYTDDKGRKVFKI